MRGKPKVRKKGTVERVIKPPVPNVPEKAQIEVQDADHLYKEIRIENTLEDSSGRKVKLKEGAEVDLVIEADPESTAPKSDSDQ
jgi:hypothetical protein